MLYRIVPALLIASFALAEDLGTWVVGSAWAERNALSRQEGVPALKPILVGSQVGQMTLAGAPNAKICFSPGSRFVLTKQGNRLLIELLEGTLEANVSDRGPWSGLVVRGGSTETIDIGTLFLVQRVAKDRDYVAVVSGKVRVGLRSELLARLGDVQPIELNPRQGLGAEGTGFSGVDNHLSRPQLPGSDPSLSSIRTTATVYQPGGNNWSQSQGELAAENEQNQPEEQTSDLPSGVNDGDALAGNDATEGQNEQAASDAETSSDMVGNDVADNVSDIINEVTTEQTVDAIILDTLNQIAADPLAGPPPIP